MEDSSSDSESYESSEEALSTAPSTKETREVLFAKVRAKIEVFKFFIVTRYILITNY